MELSVQAALFIFLAAASDQASAYQGAICGFKEYASLGVITYDEVFIEEHNIPPELDPSTGVLHCWKIRQLHGHSVWKSQNEEESGSYPEKARNYHSFWRVYNYNSNGKKDRDLRFWNQVHLAERGRQDPL